MDFLSLEQVIRQYVPLPTATNGNGWYSVLCKVCNDHGKKGPRAAFKFDNDSVGYHCFNCGHKAKFSPRENKRMPKNMVQVLRDFGVPDDEWRQVVFESLKIQEDSPLVKGTSENQVREIEPKELELPYHFYLLADAGPDDKWAQVAKAYLELERGVDPNSYPFMLSRETGVPAIDRWRRRLIIPYFKGDKLIFWQGRALYETNIKKYESPSTLKERVLYGFDRLFEHTDAPLYVTEGFFDALPIDGVALLGNEVTEAQAEWLRRSKRKKVYVPDRFGDGDRVALEMLNFGFSISTPEIGNCKDINEAVVKYGKLYVMKSLAENTVSDSFTAQTRLGVYCVKKNAGEKEDQASSRKQRRSR